MRKIILSVLGIVALTGCAAFRNDRQHSFQIEEPMPILSEAVALEKAKEALRMDGFTGPEWNFYRTDDPKEIGPDGKEDRYLIRFSLDPNVCRAYFSDGKRLIGYDIRLVGDQVHCRRFRGL